MSEHNEDAAQNLGVRLVTLTLTSLRLDLPATPVDGFEIEYFTIRAERVQRIRLKYHANSKWSDVCQSKGGVHFVDQWQVFVDDDFSGRMVGWSAPADRKNTGDDFATREYAISALIQKFEERAAWADHEAREYRERAARLTDTSVGASEEPTPLRKAEIEERLEAVALAGLCNIYHAITGKECERYQSLGMATSAVSALLVERDNLNQLLSDEKPNAEASANEARWQERQGEDYGSY